MFINLQFLLGFSFKYSLGFVLVLFGFDVLNVQYDNFELNFFFVYF